MDHIGTATYSPQDDKLRLYPDARLDDETYGELCGRKGEGRGMGFRWAPKQELFFAHWTPAREDKLLELCGDVEDETMSLEERAAQRAERFALYKANAISSAEQSRRAVDRIADGIPLGQPILVGHHSEKRARRDQERIASGMRRTVDEFKRADYWERRAAGSLRHADRSKSARTVHNRIKKLEAEVRKRTRRFTPGAKDWIRNLSHFLWENRAESWSASESESAVKVEAYRSAIEKRETRWIEHLEMRLAYERAVYGDSALIPVERPEMPGLEIGGAVSYWGGVGGPIVRINKGRDKQLSSVSIMDSYRPGGRQFQRTVKAADIRRVFSKEGFESLDRKAI